MAVSVAAATPRCLAVEAVDQRTKLCQRQVGAGWFDVGDRDRGGIDQFDHAASDTRELC